MTLYFGEFSKPVDLDAVIHIKHPADTETLQSGDVVERWGYIFEWDNHCLKASQLEAWRRDGDPLCDAALRSMFNTASSSVGVDLLERLQSDASMNPGGASQAYLEEVSKMPPSDLAATPAEIREGQKLFLDNSVAMMQALMYFSLAGGFASPRITRVLQSVSYLVPPRGKGDLDSQLAGISPEMNDRIYNRLIETFQFVLDIMGCTASAGTGVDQEMLEPGGTGWKSAVRVRLLHGVARLRIMDKICKNGYRIEEDGMPINQEDMAATLCSFCVAPLWCLSRLYFLPIPPPTPSQVSAFIALWRHVGFYLGVDPSILRKHFASPHTASKLLASCMVHLFTSDPVSHDGSPLLFPTLPILLATSNRKPFAQSFERTCALTRYILGPSLASHLGVPQTSRKAGLQMRLSLILVQIPVLFSHVYPRRGWSATRSELTREALARIVRFQMGMRRTSFRARGERGELGADVVALEAVKPDPVGGAKMVGRYHFLMLEMVGVIAGVIISTVGIAILGVSQMRITTSPLFL